MTTDVPSTFSIFSSTKTTSGDYYKLFLITDVFLLAAVVVCFRKICYEIYGLDCCHCCVVDLLKAMSEALASLKKIVLSVGTPTKLRQDNAKEFLSEQFKIYCLYTCILQEKTIPETPQQIGLDENSQDDVGKSNFLRIKDQKVGCETSRRQKAQQS